jgi:DNA (cytosine-5)-methyltransferase 1
VNTHTLTAEGFDASEDGTGRGTPLTVSAFMAGQGAKAGSIAYEENISPSLKSASSGTNRAPTIAHTLRDNPRNNSDPSSEAKMHIYEGGSAVRRLTPTECERLQGFPDRWTLLPAQADDLAANPKPDSHRYSMMGNAVTVNVAQWLGTRIMQHIELKAAA